jgi:DNA-binding IclR family transcriptional regulator
MKAPVSSCHALLRTLESLGYVYFLGDSKRVYPTKRLSVLAEAISAHDPVLDQLSPVLHALREQTGETAILGKRQGDRVIYLDIAEGTHTIRYAASPGEKKPLHSSAIGKALLGSLGERDLAGLLEELRLDSVTDRTITSIGALRKDIEQGRARGYFVTRGENVPEVMAIAATRLIDGDAYGVAIAGPIMRLERNLDRYAALLLDAVCTSRRYEDATVQPSAKSRRNRR